MAYARRITQQALNDMKQTWTIHRVWVTAAPIAAVLLLQIGRNGWRSVLNPVEALKSFVFGFLLAVGGTVLIAVCRAPLLLDRQRHERIRELEEELSRRTQPLVQEPTFPNDPMELKKWFDSLKTYEKPEVSFRGRR